MSKAHPPELKKVIEVLCTSVLEKALEQRASSSELRLTVLKSVIGVGRDVIFAKRNETSYEERVTSYQNKFMDKKLSLKLNGGRAVAGILRGFDPFMNLVIDEAVEECKDGQRNNVGMVVIRGNSIILLESLDRI